MAIQTNFEPALVVASPDNVSWDDEADLLVIGFGGAGAVAAIAARERHADVLVVERFAGGGATAYSGGVIYAGATRFQREAGFDDTAQSMYEYLRLEESAVGDATLRKFCAGSNDDIEWLSARGVPFSAEAYTDKTAYPPEGRFLYYSGNEKTPAYKERAKPAPRGHRTVGQGFTGNVYFDALRKATAASGARLWLHAPVRRLVLSKAGVVLGVEITVIPEQAWAEHQALYERISPMKPFAAARHERAIAACAQFEARHEQRALLRARKGIVLAAGGFVYNLPMIRRHRSLLADMVGSMIRIGSMGCDGSGIELGKSAGAATDLMERFFIGRAIAPPRSFLAGILVDGEGRRFINEDAYTGFIGDAIADLPRKGAAWLILDRASYLAALRECLFPGRGLYLYTLPSLLNLILGGTKKARSVETLARKCGLDCEALSRAIAENNVAARSGAPDALGKSPDNMRAIARAPYYAVNMDLGNRFQATLLFSLGGLRVSEETGAVLRADGTPIGGLFAAGRVAVGLCSRGYLSGMSLADTVFSGRRAARSSI